jgi:general secretion pathway protein N
VRRLVIWLLAAALSVTATIIIFWPASWLALALEQQTGGRLTLGDAQGTLWHGSAFIGAAPGASDPVTPLLPGRFVWQLSPLVLVGQVDARVENPSALAQPLRITGSWREWQAGAGSIALPAERLAGLGAPLNTLAPSGQMQLKWDQLQLARRGNSLDVRGRMTLEMEQIASRLSPIKPLGAYRMTLDWQGQEAQLVLATVNGPLLLNGTGNLVNGHFQFSGKAQAEAGKEEVLANLLNLLGQRRKEGDKDVIALEFK